MTSATKENTLNAKYPRVMEELSLRIHNGIYTEALPGVKQLAKELGVNFMTVDKAIRKMEAQGLVYRISRKGTYVKRMRNIAFCFDSKCSEGAVDSIYSVMSLAAQEFLSQHNCPMFIDSGMTATTQSMGMLKNRIDGMIFKHISPDQIFKKEKLELPVVQVLSTTGSCPFDHVTYNNATIGPVAARWMLENSHQTVAYVGDMIPPLFKQRLDTFVEAAQAGGATVLYSPYGEGTWEPRHKNVRKQMAKIFSGTPQPTAIFCPSDNEVGMVYDSLYRYGLEPMKDVQVISCNNDPHLLAFCDPAPISIDIHMAKIGRLAAKRLLERIDNPVLPKREDILEPTLVMEEEQ